MRFESLENNKKLVFLTNKEMVDRTKLPFRKNCEGYLVFNEKIVQLNKTYLKDLVKLNSLAFKPLEGKLGKHSLKGMREYFEFTFKKGKVFGYFIEKELVGCVGIVVEKKFLYGEIEHLLVNPEYQNKGIGKELMRFIEDYSRRELKLKQLKLHVRCKNEKAISFYEKNGFNKHAFIMGKELK